MFEQSNNCRKAKTVEGTEVWSLKTERPRVLKFLANPSTQAAVWDDRVTSWQTESHTKSHVCQTS